MSLDGVWLGEARGVWLGESGQESLDGVWIWSRYGVPIEILYLQIKIKTIYIFDMIKVLNVIKNLMF